jgi:ribonuclease D
MAMLLITETEALDGFCRRLTSAPYITVDTEFMREKTYWPVLCLVQIAGPDEAAVIDAQAPGIDLAPLMALMADPKVLKVFHAARQDIEIFYHLSGKIPAPLFDTQVAAMVCGFGDSVGYETLATKLARARIDKSMRFTDWSHRPLSEKQLHYALSDVTHLRVAYEKLQAMLDESGRTRWVEEEMAILTDPATYRPDPDQAWRRLKVRSTNARFLSVLRELAAWRDLAAQEKDVPRNRILRDDALLNIAAHAPKSETELYGTRGLGRNGFSPAMKEGILAAVAKGREREAECVALLEEKIELPRGLAPVVDLLKVLLKMKSESSDVAQRLIAGSADLEMIAADDNADVPALHGWRRELFGDDALALKHGKLALAVKGKNVSLVSLDQPGRKTASA